MTFEYSTKGKDYFFNRQFEDSTRLTLQHWIWLYRLNYLVHPSIPLNKEHLRVADVGTGNATWLVELLKRVPPSAQLDGFDVSADHWPATEYLPQNVSLSLVDAFSDLPEELVGKYDIVHIRTFAVVVKNNDPRGLLENLIRMLKPGGYLQWDEMDLATFLPSTISPSISSVHADDLMHRWSSECKALGYHWGWIPQLGRIFEERGLTDVDATNFEPADVLRKAFTDNALMGVGDSCLRMLMRGDDTALGTRAEYLGLFDKMAAETRKGVTISADLHVVVGRKAGSAAD